MPYKIPRVVQSEVGEDRPLGDSRARRSQEEPGVARRSPEEAGGVRRNQEEPEGARRNQ